MADDEPALVDGIWGCIVYTEHYSGPEAGTVTIDRADPFALVLDEILIEALCRDPRPRSSVLRLRPAPETGWCAVGPGVCEYPSHPFCFTGWLMSIDLPGKTLVYRIGRFRSVDNTWEASWPD